MSWRYIKVAELVELLWRLQSSRRCTLNNCLRLFHKFTNKRRENRRGKWNPAHFLPRLLHLTSDRENWYQKNCDICPVLYSTHSPLYGFSHAIYFLSVAPKWHPDIFIILMKTNEQYCFILHFANLLQFRQRRKNGKMSITVFLVWFVSHKSVLKSSAD